LVSDVRKAIVLQGDTNVGNQDTGETGALQEQPEREPGIEKLQQERKLAAVTVANCEMKEPRDSAKTTARKPSP
jgi:hypothetical protein